MASIESPAGIAIIGMSGRFPGASDLGAFWGNLVRGVDSISHFAEDELEPSRLETPGIRSLPNYVRARGILEGAEQFDAAFFGITPREAAILDPQHRIFLEEVWSSLENAGCDPETYKGAIGVWAGMGNSTYYLENVLPRRDVVEQFGPFQAMLANEKDFLATRASYKLNLRGPSVNVMTGCSTALVAVCQAYQALLDYQCDMAIAGGVNIAFPQRRGYLYQEGAIGSPDGCCRPFDARAAGTVFSDGIGLVVLKRLEEAQADGDYIYAIIRGTAINNDGSGKVSFTAPSIAGQAEVIAMAHAVAGVEPESVSYVETHGTATPLGDPIEIAALTQAFRAGTTKKCFCAVGSVKSNIGHLDAGAGIAGLIKTALALHHRQLPASLHYVAPNPQINFDESPFFVNSEFREWPRGSTPRRAGVSSFGIGGTNAHVVLEEAPNPDSTHASRAEQLIVLSAKTPSSLDAATARLARHFRTHPDVDLADVAHTLQTGRRAFACRRAVVGAAVNEVLAALESQQDLQSITGQVERTESKVAFLFPGQGSQHVGMAAELYRHEREFADEFTVCAEALQPILGLDIRDLVYTDGQNEALDEQRLTDTSIAQPVLFSLEFALARLWMSWGIRPEGMIGHSLGEFVAACLAGVFSREQALAVVAARGRIMQAQPRGSMMAVRMPLGDLEPLLGEHLVVAGLNAPQLNVVSGPESELKALEGRLAEQKINCRFLATSHAFHSKMMDGALQPFREILTALDLKRPTRSWISCVTGDWISPEQAVDPEYWVAQLRQPVRFSKGIQKLLQPGWALLEVGPGHALATLVRLHPGRPQRQAVVASLDRVSGGDTKAILSALGALWVVGVTPDWSAVNAGETRRRVPLPTYPFERKRFWIEPAAIDGVSTAPPTPVDWLEPSPSDVEAPQSTLADFASNETETSGRIRALLSASSGISPQDIGANQSFVELGFDSLLLTQVSSAIETTFGEKVTFRQLMEAFPSLQLLARHLETRLSERKSPESSGRQATDGCAQGAFDPLPPSARGIRIGGAAHSEAELPPPLARGIRIRANLPVAAEHAPASVKGLRSGDTTQGSSEPPPASVRRVRLGRDAQGNPAWFAPDPEQPGRFLQCLPKPQEGSQQGVQFDPFASTVPENLAPLSEAQQEIWAVVQMGPEPSCAYNQCFCLSLSGDVIIDALKRAVQHVFDRHEAMRTTFDPYNGSQTFDPPHPVDVPVIDLRGLSAEKRLQRIQAILEEEVGIPLELTRGTCARVKLVIEATDAVRIVLTAHHIVCDGWTSWLFFRDLATFYAAECRSGAATIPLAVPYRQHLLREASAEGRAQADASLRYWQAQFAERAPFLDLPTDYARPLTKGYKGACASRRLTRVFSQDVSTVAGRLGVTSVALLLSVFQTLLFRLTGQADIVVGLPLSARHPMDRDGLAGHATNLLPMRARMAADASFADLASATRRALLDAQENQNLTFGTLVRTLRLPRDASRGAFVSVLFNVDRSRMAPSFLGAQAALTVVPRRFVNFELELQLVDTRHELILELAYNADLFSAETIHRWLEHFEQLLAGVLANPDTALSDIPLLSDADRETLTMLNNTDAEYPRKTPLAELVEDQVERSPKSIAVVCGTESISYGDLNAQANRLARELCVMGACPDRLVGVFIERSIDLMIALLAIVKAGAAYVPLDPHLPRARLAHMVRDSGIELILIQEPLRTLLPDDTMATVIAVDDSAWQIHEAENLRVEVSPSDLAYVIYTSGSTGKPKGVAIPRGALNNLLWSMRDWLKASAKDTLLAVSTISFDIAGLELWLPLLVGARVILATRDEAGDGNRLLDLLGCHNVNVMQATPATWRLLLQSGWRGGSNLQLLCGGEAMPPDLAATLTPIVGRLWNVYGPTETTIWSTGYLVKNGEGPILIGKPIANTQCYILDERRQLVPIGVTGELYIAGDGLARGYFNRPELTEDRFIPNPFASTDGARMYRTGDLARYRIDGNIECLGRTDHQVKIRGYRIELGEIESVLMDEATVRQAVVVAREDQPGDVRLVAYVVGSEEDINERAFRSHLKRSLPDYMVPQHFVALTRLPLTPSGKVDKKALPAPSVSEASDVEVEEPRDWRERRLVEIWKTVLNAPTIDVTASFFDLGGHSLLAVPILNQINESLGVRLPLATFFQHPTVRLIAAKIVELTSSPDSVTKSEWSTVVPIQPSGVLAPLYCVAGLGGNPMNLRYMSNALGHRQPFYGIQHRGVDGILTPHESIAAMAEESIHDTKAVQPAGPYFLAGYSMGGLVAYEMAHQLLEAGEGVGGVILLDTFNPQIALWSTRQRVQAHFQNLAEVGPSYIKTRAVARMSRFFDDLRQRNMVRQAQKGNFEARFALVTQAALDAERAYVPPTLNAPVVLIKTIAALPPTYGIGYPPHESNGWRDLVRGRFDILPINSGHLEIASERVAPEVAGLINSALQVFRARPM